MNNQIEKLQMLIALEKSILAAEYGKQKKQAFLIALTLAFFVLSVLAVNVALFFHVSDVPEYASSAWVMVGLNTFLAAIPGTIVLTNRGKSGPEIAAYDIRDALAGDLKESAESGFKDMQQSLEKIHNIGKDIKTFSEGGINALIPVIKLASEVLDKKDKG